MQLLITALALSFGGVSASAAPSVADLARAMSPRPRAPYTAANPEAIRGTLNALLTSGPLALPVAKPCEAFTLEDLEAWQVLLRDMSHPDLSSSLLRPGDKRRRRMPNSRDEETDESSSSKIFAAELADEIAYAQAHPEVSGRDRERGGCVLVGSPLARALSRTGGCRPTIPRFSSWCATGGASRWPRRGCTTSRTVRGRKSPT